MKEDDLSVSADPKKLTALYDDIMKVAFSEKTKEEYTTRDLLSVFSTTLSTVLAGYAFSEIPEDEREGFIFSHIMTLMDCTHEMLEDASERGAEE